MAPINGKLTAALLGGRLLLACLASDGFLANSMLTLPFVVATLVSAGVLAWGVPKLRSLKLGQVIREDGPQGHLNKAGIPTMGGLLVVPVGLDPNDGRPVGRSRGADHRGFDERRRSAPAGGGRRHPRLHGDRRH